MIDWRDCIVPDIPCSKIYVWVAYAKEPPYLPVAVEDSVRELARRVGVKENTIYQNWGLYQNGKLKHARYRRVKVGIDKSEINKRR